MKKKEDISISNPDELNKHLQHSSPVTWIVLGAVILSMVGFFVWSLIYKIQIKVTGTASILSGEASLRVEDKSLDKLKVGQKVYISNQEGILSFNDNKPVVNNIALSDGEYTYYIVIGEKRPIDFLIGK